MSKKKHNHQTEQELQTLIIDDVGYKTQTNKMFDSRKPYTPINPYLLRSFMPGNIQEVFVAEGTEVKTGEPLLILEAMKMKNVITSPFDARVKKIHVNTRDTVPKNHILVELEP